MSEKRADEVEPISAAPHSAPISAATSVLVLDRKVVQTLFASLRTSIPIDVQQALLRDSLEEVKFLIARQPRLSSFHHRRRESLRHPALAMSTKNYYQRCRRKRIELAVQAVTAEQQSRNGRRSDAHGGDHGDGGDAFAAQREAEMVDLLLAEYAQSGGFQEESGWFNHHANMANPGESVRFNTSMSFGSRGVGATSGQLMTSVTNMDLRSEASFSMGESRGGGGGGGGRSVFFTEVGNTSMMSNSVGWRNPGTSILHHGNGMSGTFGAMADSVGLGNSMRLNSPGGNNGGESTGAYPRGGKNQLNSNNGGTGRFFTKRHDRAEGGGPGSRGGGAGGDGGPRWGTEMHAMLIRRAEEELRAGSGGDPYLLTSPRPIELLLSCYGGVQRDPAVMAMGAASLAMGMDGSATTTAASSAAAADADSLFNAVVEEDLRWDQLAQCYRQLLRDANAVRQAAAAAVARNPLVNDVIRRFWERLTVSAAAQQAHKAREATKKRDAVDAAVSFSKRVHSRLAADAADEDDLDEIQPITDDGTTGGTAGDTATARSPARGSPRTAKDGQDTTPRKGLKAGAKSKKKKRAGVVGFSAAAAGAGAASSTPEPASTVAYYLNPLQYVYLHTRMAHVLLPDSDALDMELLYFIQEDLLVDAAYNEADPEQTAYFGAAPHLTSHAGGAAGRSRGAEKQRGTKDRFADWPEDGGPGSDSEGEKSPSLAQRFLSVRRYGYNIGEDGEDGETANGRQDDKISVLVRHPTGIHFGGSDDASTSHGRNSILSSGGGGNNGGGDGKATTPNALPLVNMCFSISELPSLTYQQFWCSMMELADNWTCCAGHPVETAIFLWELYAEVFGHNWGAEDEALATALEEKAATVSKAERARMDAEVEDALNSFNNLVQALRARERETRPMSSSASAGHLNVMLSEGLEFLPGGGTRERRRKRGPRKSDAAPVVPLDDSALWNSLSSTDSDLSVAEWDKVATGETGASGEWVYVERVGEDGVTRRYRRRVIHRQRQRRHRGDRGDCDNDSTRHSSNDGSQADSFVLEEELGEDGAVVRQRKRRRKGASAGKDGRRHRGKKGKDGGMEAGSTEAAGADGEEAETRMTSASLYEHRRRYDEDRAKRLRRLEPHRRVEPGSSRASSTTSWSSIDDGTAEDRRNGRRRRRRTRRTGPRRDRLLSRHGSGDAVDTSHHAGKDAAKAKAKTETGGDKAGAGGGKTSLTAEEQKDLQDNKEWLCAVLGAKGICLPPHMFDDPAEQVLLYELLRLTKESEARGGGGLGGGVNGEGFSTDGEGRGSGGTDLSRLAALLAQSAAFNLNGLDDSALMQRLLGEGGGGGSAFLSPQQLQSILLALANGQKLGDPASGGAAAPETESVRNRRLRLLQMLEERQARERQEEEEAAAKSHRDATDDAMAADGPAEADSEDRAKGPAASATAASSRPASATPSSLRPTESVYASNSTAPPGGLAATVPPSFHGAKVPSPPRRPKPPARPAPAEVNEAEWVLSPATEAERREQERLFRELEAYWTEQASQRGRYKVDIIEYTPDQLNEFFAHLHLGSRQRALLRGRAPLAAPTSLVGGTLHQDTPRTDQQDSVVSSRGSHRASAATAAGVGTAGAALPPPLTPAPVKLFTLTTESSLDGALRESYQSYVNDKTFSTAAPSSRAKGSSSSSRLQHPQRESTKQRLPPLPQSTSTKGGTADRQRLSPKPAAAAAAAPPRIRRGQPSSLASATSPLPKV